MGRETGSDGEGAGDEEVLVVPACFSSDLLIERNPIRQLVFPFQPASVEFHDGRAISVRLQNGQCHPIVRSRKDAAEGQRALLIPRPIPLSAPGRLDENPRVRWLGSPAASDPSDVLQSLDAGFSFVQEDPARDRAGLRRPQLGAVHAMLGYWSTGSLEPATIVMPTGTGKTDAMVALLACARPTRLLVVVPSDALRAQLAAKFESYGVLQQFGVIASVALPPVVGQIRHGFTSPAEAAAFVAACNVVIATPNALGASSPDARAALLGACSHLFVDEAHHVAAATWREIRDAFDGKPTVQFTATPWREDGRQLGGCMVYRFPLHEAQKDRFFSTINYVSVIDFENPDRAIALRAIQALRQDLANDLDHILMARVKRIGRAEEVLQLYRELAPELGPVLLHSQRGVRDQRSSLEAVRTRESRIMVCVDMLGEGFDLPSLKIAAIHDPHKSLGITLQFVGRFARVAGDSIGDATVIVGRPDREYDANLRQLFAEDADWNSIIRDLSERAAGYQQAVSDFEQGFGSLPDEVSLRSLLPKMSTVVYRTRCENWEPLGVLSVYPEEELLTVPIGINMREGVAWFVTETKTPVRWGDLQTVEEVSHDLFVIYWDRSRQLLYINSSNNDGMHEGLAKAVCGEDVARITGEQVYRVMAQVNRLVPTNVGVLDIRNRARRFSLHVGADVSEGFPVAEAQTKTKTNIFAYGYENGSRVSVGASLKGRIWSYQVAPSLKHWMDWCDHVGSKLIDGSISVDEVMKHFIRPEVIETRPPYVPLALEWPPGFFRNTGEEVRIEHAGSSWPLVDIDLKISAFTRSGPIPFTASTPDWSLPYEVILGNGEIKVQAGVTDATVVYRHERVPLSGYLSKRGLFIHLEQDALVVPPGLLLKPDRTLKPFDVERLQVLDWSGVNIRKESQGPSRDADSVQAYAIGHLPTIDQWDIVVDDDGPGEIADIVAIRATDHKLLVYLLHCKYSSADVPGYRIGDLYEVCGQAQKCVRWRRSLELFFQHLVRREKGRTKRHGRSGILRGTPSKLYELQDCAHLLTPEFTIGIAQPGISKAQVSQEQLELLGCTELYIYETAYIPLAVFCSQ